MSLSLALAPTTASSKGKDREVEGDGKTSKTAAGPSSNDPLSLVFTLSREPQVLNFVFPDKPTDDIHIYTRKEDDLPPEIKGKAFWQAREEFHRSSYVFRENNKDHPVEYLNFEWFYVYWDSYKKSFSVAQEDRIVSPNLYGLGTISAPLKPRSPEDERSTESQELTVNEEEETRSTEEVTPVVSRQQTEVFYDLAVQLETTSITKQPYIDNPREDLEYEDPLEHPLEFEDMADRKSVV